jgi:glycosyltransferase involved in cell wall biosynthesis/predicted O-methyltransferase YrrM
MKLAWLSNDPWTSSGYGKQTRLLLPKLQEAGHEICFLSNWGLQGGILEWRGIKCYPFFQAVHATDVLIPHIDNFFGAVDDGLVISFLDIWMADARPFALTNWLAWTPVDHEPVCQTVLNKLQGGGAIPVSCSQWGKKQLEQAGLDAGYIPCAIDSKLLKIGDKRAARQALGLPTDAFIAAMVAVNKGSPSRKSFPEVYVAFKRLLDMHDDALLYIHSETTGVPAGNGLNLRELQRFVGIPEGKVIYADQYKYLEGYSDEEMVNVFQAMDVLCSPSMAEGFGVPIVEAQACGKPVIVSNCTSMPELCQFGTVVNGQNIYLPVGAWALHPNVDEIVDGMIYAYENHEDQDLQLQARSFALGFDVDLVVEEFWKPKLASLEQQIKPYEIMPEMDYFKQEYALKLKHRYKTFLRALDMLARSPNGKVIVETGTMRTKGRFQADGGSTYLFGEFASKLGGRVHSVDISSSALANAKEQTTSFSEFISFHEGDSIDFLHRFEDAIGLLYLDSLDCIDAERASQEHQLHELRAAWQHLQPGAIVLLDDNAVGDGGKTRLSKQYLEKQGAECLVDAYQSLWIKR